MENAYPIVPVLMYHSIADGAESSPYGHLSIPIGIFSTMISYLKKHKFSTITLNEMYMYLSANIKLPPNPVIITFDDGYLDNWVNAFPILKKNGVRATIFIVPEFVDPRKELRPTLLDVWQGKLRRSDVSCWGFLSWNEMKEMTNSGLIDIQSHSLTHTNYFQEDEIVDFHHPGDSYPWLAWNQCPDRKFLWPCENQDEFVGFGAPIYSYGRALAAPQYFPDESLIRFLQEYVLNQGERNFFKRPDWRGTLFDVTKKYRTNNYTNVRRESQKEYENRVQQELCLSKELIQGHIGKKVDFLCWPGGAYNSTIQNIAEEVGYLATTKGSSKNTWGADPRRIDRIGADVVRTGIHPLMDRFISLLLFAAKVEGYRGNPIYSNFLRLSLKTVHACRWLLNHRKGRSHQGVQ